MTADLFYLGITQRHAPLAVREAISPSVDKQRTMLDRLQMIAPGRMVVSTCERFEVYAHTEARSAGTWRNCLASWFQLPNELVTQHAMVLEGDAVARHLLSVAAGLDSRVLGEPQILGQVRDAYLFATECAALDPVLSALGRAAIRAGKRVRHETPINRGNRSIPSLTVDRVVSVLNTESPKLLVLGSGRLAGDVASTWVDRGFGSLTLIARNTKRVQIVAEPLGARSEGMDGLAEAVAEADAIVACTAAPSYLIDQATIGSARTRSLCIVDLCVPRNVDPMVAQIPSVTLCHLDDLLSGETRPTRIAIDAERIVDEEYARFEQWRSERRAVATVTELVRVAKSAPTTHSPALSRELHQRIVGAKSRAVAPVTTA